MFWYFLNEALFWLRKKSPGKYSLSKPIFRNNVLHIMLELLTRMIICEESQMYFSVPEETFTFQFTMKPEQFNWQ